MFFSNGLGFPAILYEVWIHLISNPNLGHLLSMLPLLYSYILPKKNNLMSKMRLIYFFVIKDADSVNSESLSIVSVCKALPLRRKFVIGSVSAALGSNFFLIRCIEIVRSRSKIGHPLCSTDNTIVLWYYSDYVVDLKFLGRFCILPLTSAVKAPEIR